MHKYLRNLRLEEPFSHTFTKPTISSNKASTHTALSTRKLILTKNRSSLFYQWTYQTTFTPTMGRNKKIFETPEQKFAVTANDEEIWPRLTCCNKAVEISSYKKTSEPWLDIRVISEPYHPNYTRRPQQLPFTLKDLQDFVSNGLPPPWKRFSVRWASKSNKSTDTTYGDGFRAVFIFRTIEFMIRPVEEGVGPGRLQ